jgi:EAL domain-containing protein (putative c-di-GMP-specific phosphodiesterase class I)
MLDELRVTGAIRMEFQPIVTLDDLGVPRLYMIEALARGPRGTSMERPDVMFEYARRKGEEPSIDMICIDEALVAAATLPGRPGLSVNVHGSTLAAVPQFARKVLDAAASLGFEPSRLMFEIVEHRGPWNVSAFRESLRELRQAGALVAIDDLGVGSSNYGLFIDCRPDHIKIDRTLVQGCSRDLYKCAVLESIVSLCRASDGTPIAEGVETQDDLATVQSLGIDCFQGWLFAHAMPAAEVARHPLLQPTSQSPRPA